MTNRIGLNVNSSGIPNAETLAFCNGGASAYVIMNDPGMAQRVYDQTGAIVISRADWPDDIDMVPAKLLGLWKARKQQAPDVHHYWPNEPYPVGSDFLDELIGLMNDAADAGLKACVGNFAWTSALQNDADFDDVANGKWDKFLTVASQWSNGGHGVIGGHDYTTGALPWGCAGRDAFDMTRGALPPGGWPDWNDVWAAGRSNYHMFRWIPLARRCYKLCIAYPRMVLTEFGWDRMEDLEGPGGVLEALDGFRGGKPDPGDGIISQRSLFTRWWPQWTDVEAAVAQLQWAEDTYPPHVVGMCLFAVNRDAHWVNYNLEKWPELLAALPGIKGGTHD